MAIPAEPIYFNIQPLVSPPLELIAEVLKKELPAYFSEVIVEVVQCPDLREEPFHLTCEGLGGKPSIISLGHLNNLMPIFRKDKVFNLKEVSEKIGLSPAFFIGPALMECTKAGFWGEGITDICISSGKVSSKMKAAYYNRYLGKHFLEEFPDSTSCCNGLADLFGSEGKKNRVLKVHCTKRKCNVSFPSCLRKILQDKFGDQTIGLGGTFVLKRGSAKCHVCRVAVDDPPGTATTWEELKMEATEFLDFSAPLTCIGTLMTSDPGLDLRLEHYHCFNLLGDGGHFHFDTTPDSAEYLGYFSVAETLYRVL